MLQGQALALAVINPLPARTVSQLTVNGRNEGPHVFIVHLRDANGSFMPGERAGQRSLFVVSPVMHSPALVHMCHGCPAAPAWQTLECDRPAGLTLCACTSCPLSAGVRCADNGPKQGLLGVDNGQIW